MISVLNRAAGFFSQFFFTMNHYLYCKKRRINFKLDSSNWTFGYCNGWTDYFKSFDLVYEDAVEFDGSYSHGTVLENVPYFEYAGILREVYQYNDFIQNKIREKMDDLQLVAGTYDSIFIRRGDKLLCESIIIETEEYIKGLLEKNPECKTIFLQTDDYNCYLDIMNYLQNNGLNIRVITLCNENLFGFTMDGTEFFKRESGFSENKAYIDKVRDINKENKVIFDLNKEEMLEHMLTFLIGLDIVLNSNLCATDYSSNVARFIKLWKGETTFTVFKGESVYHSAGQDMDMNIVRCPAY